MSTSPSQLANLLTSAFAYEANTLNAALITVYQKEVAATPAGGTPPPPPLLWVVNSSLIAQMEVAPVGTPWPAPAMTQSLQYPAIPVPAAPQEYVLGPQVANEVGLYQLTVNGPYPSNGQQINISGLEYIAIWAGPFGPVYAQAAGGASPAPQL